MAMSEEGTTMRNDLWAESVGIPEYVCHKHVRAAKVIAVAHEREVTIEGGHKHDIGPQRFEVMGPEVGGYLVFYKDGYVSYSPAKAFEEGYAPVASLSESAG